MMDSFNNEIQVGDRILCLDTGIYTSHRINQIGTVAKIYYNRMIVNFDLADNRDWGYLELNVPSHHGNCLIPDQDIFVKIETHTEVEYREGDKVLCYCGIDNDHPFVGRVARELIDTGEYEIIDEYRNSLILNKSEILFLLERKHFEVGDEVVVQKSSNFELLFGEGYNQSIPARIDVINSYNIAIEIDNPLVGWQRNGDTIHSYWTLTDTKRLLPREFSYSLPFV